MFPQKEPLGNPEILTILTADTWYNCWLVIDNLADEFELYLNAVPGADAAASDQLTLPGQSSFVFRDGSAGDLRSFFVKTGGGNSINSGPLYLDDIYVENTAALNLDNPTAYRHILADITRDHAVDLADLAVLAHEWLSIDGLLAADIAPACPDGIIDLADLSSLTRAWHTTP